jgi:D-amino-acid oxidase
MKKIYIIGAGVNGLTSAVKIAEHFKHLNVLVKVISDEKSSHKLLKDSGRLWGPYLIGSGSDEKIA